MLNIRQFTVVDRYLLHGPFSSMVRLTSYCDCSTVSRTTPLRVTENQVFNHISIIQIKSASYVVVTSTKADNTVLYRSNSSLLK